MASIFFPEALTGSLPAVCCRPRQLYSGSLNKHVMFNGGRSFTGASCCGRLTGICHSRRWSRAVPVLAVYVAAPWAMDGESKAAPLGTSMQGPGPGSAPGLLQGKTLLVPRTSARARPRPRTDQGCSSWTRTKASRPVDVDTYMHTYIYKRQYE